MITNKQTNKHRTKLFVNLLAGFFLLFSCNKEDNFNESQNNEVTVSKTINFKGLKVNNKFSFTEEELITPKEEGLLTILREAHDDYYKKSGLSHKFSGALDEERLVKATRDVLPYFPYQENGVNEKMIQKDFPEITAENFEENADVIDDYYNSSLNRVVANKYYNDSYISVPIDDENNPDDYTPNPPKLPYFKSEREVGEETLECFEREIEMDFKF